MRTRVVLFSCLSMVLAAVAPAQTFSLLHVFHGPDGGDPASAPVVFDKNGVLYSTTAFGGANGRGTVYKIDAKGNQSVLYSFTNGADGQDPFSGVVVGSDGNLYGTALYGGTNGFGTAFQVKLPGGVFKVIYEFAGGTQASFPGPLTAMGNALYGGGGGGAPFYGGVVYRLDTSGETDLYTFAGGADGANPNRVVVDGSGNIYGVAGGGNLTCTVSSSCGLVYKIDASGKYSVLHVFVGPDGRNPAGVLPDGAGNLYGVTAGGGAHNVGTVFKPTPSGQLTTLYTFTGAADGGQPNAGLIRDAAGNFYGTTQAGGIVNDRCFQGCGVVFELSPAAGTWKEMVLHSFNGDDGYGPEAPLTMDAAGSLYGTTSTGGDFSCTTIAAGSSCGVVFKISR